MEIRDRKSLSGRKLSREITKMKLKSMILYLEIRMIMH